MSEIVTLLDEIDEYVNRFVIMGARERSVVALWTFHTWAFEAADTTPYLDVSSPVKQCGKTRLFEVLELLVRRPQFGANHTEATLFRTIDKKEPTLLLDEIDRTFGKDQKLYAGIMAVLNTGYRHGATIPRNVGEGANMTVKDFKTFCPKAFAGIGTLPDTLTDRSIPIRLERRAPSQTVERFRERRERHRTEGLRERLKSRADGNFDVLDQAEPVLPEALSDRQQDVWEPLFAIADLAGGGWDGRARAAAIGLHEGQPDGNEGIRLLAASKAIFNGQSVIRSTDLIRGLVEDADGPWAIWWGKDIADADAYPDKSSAIFSRLGAKLARELRPFGVTSRTIRDGGVTFKGYEREPFEPVWERYLPVSPALLGNTGHIGNTAGDTVTDGIESGNTVTDGIESGNALTSDVTDVTDVTEYRGVTQDEQARLIRDWNADVYARARDERARKAAALAAPTEESPDQQGLLGSVGPDAKEER